MKRRNDSADKGAGSGCMARLVVLFDSWGRRWKNRKSFKAFDRAVDNAIKTDPVLNDLRMARRRRINEIIIEMGNKS
jgi:hypothetical protein